MNTVSVRYIDARETNMHTTPPIFSVALIALLVLPACATATRAAVGTVGATGRVVAGTAGAATKVAIGTAGVAGNAAIATASTGQRTAAAAATGAANGAAREGGKLAVRGVASAGRAGFSAMMQGDSSISEETLAHRAGLTLSYPREDLSIGNVFEDGNRTDFTALSLQGETANCFVLTADGAVGDAVCRPASQ